MIRGMRWSPMLRGGLHNMNGGQYRPQGPGGAMNMRFMRGRGSMGGYNRGGGGGYGDRGMRNMRGSFH